MSGVQKCIWAGDGVWSAVPCPVYVVSDQKIRERVMLP